LHYKSIYREGLFSSLLVVITGGGSGIGRCMAHELTALGAKVVITGREQRKLDRVAKEIREDGGEVDTLAFDIREEVAVQESVATIIERHGPIDGLINNAGGQFSALLEDISAKGWETVIRTNLTGGFLMSREVMRQSMRANGGSIVSIVADNWSSMPYLGHTAAARAGMVNLTQTASIEWAHYGIRINAVAPGIIASSGLDEYDPAAQERIRKRRKTVPLKRFGTEEEVSAAVLFLLSPAAAFITGTTLRVDGGTPNTHPGYAIPDHNRSEPFQGFHRSTVPAMLQTRQKEATE